MLHCVSSQGSTEVAAILFLGHLSECLLTPLCPALLINIHLSTMLTLLVRGAGGPGRQMGLHPNSKLPQSPWLWLNILGLD